MKNRAGAANVIPMRVADMLAKYPPFSMFEPAEVDALAQAARVRALVKGEYLWRQGEVPKDEAYFLCRGRVEYLWSHGGDQELVDVRDVGDLLGLTALLEKEAFRVTARVAEDVLVYVLDHPALQALLEHNDAARYYVRRHMFWVTRLGVRFSLPGEQTHLERSKELKVHMDGAQVIRPRSASRLLTCSPGDTLKQAARLMSAKRVPSIVVVDGQHRPLGVLTSADMVKQAIVDEVPPSTPVEQVMASPVRTVAAGSSAMVAMLYMLRERIGQVCVTEDGTPGSRVLDVCTHKDLLAQSGHHPAGLVREIRAARGTPRLRELCDEMEQMALGYLDSGITAIYVAQVFAELHDELILALIDIATRELQREGLRLPKVDWAWINVGSDGRREQILRTDMDNAFIFRSSGDATKDEEHRRVFLRLTGRVVEAMVECGFARCQGGVMASNPRWCRTETEWVEEFTGRNLEAEGSLLRLVTLFDLRWVAGSRSLAEGLREKLFDLFAGSVYLQRRLASAVVDNPPPLNFWGNFIVEKRGSEEGRFDIKVRGLNPIRDAVRLLALRHGLTGAYSTGGRLQALEKIPEVSAEMIQSAYESYDFMFRLRTLTGLRRGDAGRYIDPSELTKLQRTLLTNAFDVQRLLQLTLGTEFRLDWSGR